MKTRNGRTWRMALILLWLGATVGISACGGRGSVETGTRYAQQGKYRAAYIEAKKVLQRDQNNASAWLLLGKASLMLGQPRDAVAELDKAHAHGINTASWVEPMATAWLVAGNYDAIVHKLPDDATLPASLRASMEALRGDALRATDKTDAARQSYQKALHDDPDQLRALLGMARLETHAGHTAAAKGWVDKAVATAPARSEAWAGKAALALEQGNRAGAEKAYRKALDLDSHGWIPQERFLARMNLADVQMRSNRFDAALENIAILERESPDQAQPRYMHAAVLYRQGHYDAAVEQLQQVLKMAPDSVAAQVLMGAVNYARGNDAQAEMYLSNAMGSDGDNAAARKLLALTYFRGGSPSQALAMLRPVVPAGTPDAELLAELKTAIAEPANGTSAPVPPDGAGTSAQSPGARAIVKAAAALQAGHDRDAIRILDAMSADDADLATRRTILLVQAWIHAGETDNAVAAAARHVHAWPDDANALVIEGTALMAAGKRDQARQRYQQALDKDQKNLAARLDLASLDALQGQTEAAARQYHQVLASDAHNVAALTALGRLAEAGGDREAAIDWYKKAVDSDAGVAEAPVRLMLMYSRERRFDDALDVARKFADATPENPVALNAWGAAELNAGHHHAALDPLHEAVELAPDVALYRVNLARAQILDKQPQPARDNLEKALAREPGQVEAVTLLAFMDQQQGQPDAALKLAQSLQKQAPDSARGAALEGDLHAAAGDYTKAAEAFAKGIARGGGNTLVLKRYEALRRAGSPRPEDVLATWLRKHPDDVPVRMQLARQQAASGDQAGAVREYEAVLKTQPTHVEALNNLAWIDIDKRPDRAVELARKAHKLAPRSSGVADTYAWALLKSGQARAALPLLREAVAQTPDAPTIRYHLAVAQAQAGDRAAARQTLSTLAAGGQTYPEHEAAATLSRQLDEAVARARHD